MAIVAAQTQIPPPQTVAVGTPEVEILSVLATMVSTPPAASFGGGGPQSYPIG